MSLVTEDDITIFPPINDAAFQTMRRNLKDYPEAFPPIVLWKGYKKGNVIVSGANTYRAYLANGMKPRTVAIEFPDRETAIKYSKECQTGRRNIESQHLAQIALSIAETTGVTQKEAAESAGISPRTVVQFKGVQESATAGVKRAVAQGDVSIKDAASVANLPASVQNNALRKVKSGKARSLSQGAILEAGKVRKPRKPKSGREAIPMATKRKWQSAYVLLTKGIDLVEMGDDEQVRAAMLVIKKTLGIK